MLIHIGYELSFDVPAPVEMLLMLYVHPQQVAVLRHPEKLIVDPPIPVRDYIDHFGNRVARLLAPAGKLRLYYDNVAEDSGVPEPTIEGATLHLPSDLPSECLQFML